MLQRVMPELMGLKNLVVLNDEAHHCYRERPGGKEGLTGDDRRDREEQRSRSPLDHRH
jgi:type III restriction enzyme